MMRQLLKFIFVVFISAIILSACSKTFPPTDQHPNILLISVDTLRSDHLSCYGYNLATSPSIDKIAENGTIFDNVLSVSSWTLPSHASMLTGKYPPFHGLQDDGVRLFSEIPTVAELLNQQQYYSIGVVSHVYVSSFFGLDKGFDVFDDTLIQKGASNPIAEKVVTRFLEHAQKIGDRRYFAFIHFFDPHWDYTPPAPYNEKFIDQDYKGKIDGTQNTILPYIKKKNQMPVEDLKQTTGLYDGEIAYVDAQIKRVVDSLQKMGLTENTVIVITSDHGEEFEEHGSFGHGLTLYSEQLRVPLIISGHKNFPPDTHRSGLVSTCDIAPTILDLAGVLHSQTFSGKSLLTSNGKDDRVVFAETIRVGFEKRAARYNGYKMIQQFQGDKKVYFNLKLDRMEQNPLIKDPSGGKLTDQLMAFNARADGGWHFKLIAPKRSMRCLAKLTTQGKFVNPRHYFSKNIYGTGIKIRKFGLNENRNEFLFDVTIKGIGEIVFDTKPFDSPIKVNVRAVTADEKNNPAYVFMGTGDKILESQPVTLSRLDSRLTGLPEDYRDTNCGVYIRAVNPVSTKAQETNLPHEAVERLKSLGYVR